MPLINVPNGTQARAIHVRQIIGLLRGIPANSEAVSLTGTSSSSAYALTVANDDSLLSNLGLALAVKNANSSVTLLDVRNAGVVVRANAASGVPFSVRNFGDSADLFSVNANGTVSIGSATVVTLTGTQTLTNKTLTSPTINTPAINGGILTSPNVANYIEMDWNSTPGGGTNQSRLWAKNDNGLYYTLPGGTIVTLFTSLNTPSLLSLGFARDLMLSAH